MAIRDQTGSCVEAGLRTCERLDCVAFPRWNRPDSRSLQQGCTRLSMSPTGSCAQWRNDPVFSLTVAGAVPEWLNASLASRFTPSTGSLADSQPSGHLNVHENTTAPGGCPCQGCWGLRPRPVPCPSVPLPDRGTSGGCHCLAVCAKTRLRLQVHTRVRWQRVPSSPLRTPSPPRSPGGSLP
jgi:hypothetical protein